MIPPDTTLTVVNIPDISIVKVEKPSVPESTSGGDGRKSSPGGSTSASSWMDQSAACKLYGQSLHRQSPTIWAACVAAAAVNGNHSDEDDDEGSNSLPHVDLPSECPCDILKTVAEQQRLMALAILNEEEIRHEERVRIVLDMENRLRQEHNNFKLALIDRLNKGFTQILMALKSSTTS